jgi:hypothetical protein
MKEINWKSLSLSLILSTIVHGTALSIFLIQYVNTTSVMFHDILSLLNNSNASGKIAYTIAVGEPVVPPWMWFLFFSVSYIFVTLISYFVIELQNRRKK